MRIRMFLTLLVALFVAGGAKADVVNSDGYVFSDGYYFWPGSSTVYTRTTEWTWVNGYTKGCYYYPGYWQARHTYTAVKLDPTANDIEAKIVALAAARDKAVLKIADRAQRSAAAAALVDKLGLGGNFGLPMYGQGIFPIPGYGGAAPALSSAGVQGNTVYGYQTLSQLSDVYGAYDPTIGLQQAERMATNIQNVAGKAYDGHIALQAAIASGRDRVAQTIAAGQARTAEILAKGRASSQALNASGAAPSSQTQTIVTAPVVGSPPPLVGPPAPDQAIAQPRVRKSLNCVSCHNGQQQPGKFDFTKWNPQTAPAGELKRVRDYVTSPDKDQRCPKGGDALTPEQFVELFTKPYEAKKE